MSELFANWYPKLEAHNGSFFSQEELMTETLRIYCEINGEETLRELLSKALNNLLKPKMFSSGPLSPELVRGYAAGVWAQTDQKQPLIVTCFKTRERTVSKSCSNLGDIGLFLALQSDVLYCQIEYPRSNGLESSELIKLFETAHFNLVKRNSPFKNDN